MPQDVSCLVSYVSETRNYTQSYVFNGTIDSQGNFKEGWGLARRTVSETTTIYKGTKAEVEAATLAAVSGTRNFAQCRQIAGPWWEGTVTAVTYGNWEVVEPVLGPAQPSS